MNKADQRKLYIIFIILTTFLNTWLLGAQLLLLMGGLFTLTIIAIKSTKSEKEKRIIAILSIAYPFIEFAIKVLIMSNIFDRTYFYINRVEHTLFSFFITYLLYIIVKNIIYKFNDSKALLHQKFSLAIITISILNLFGVLNEFLEIIIRLIMKIELSSYYEDTMIDLLINLVASIIMTLILIFYDRKND